ncbi:MAG: hypothetical protein CVT64_06965 [Actinobacteria bacterium HGW-Actinobacteria-4]|nr:MAG: hypothetical protein CVT64_06965 [Actinobacteria bacterium HGW-Actinobacteria-4]
MPAPLWRISAVAVLLGLALAGCSEVTSETPPLPAPALFEAPNLGYASSIVFYPDGSGFGANLPAPNDPACVDDATASGVFEWVQDETGTILIDMAGREFALIPSGKFGERSWHEPFLDSCLESDDDFAAKYITLDVETESIPGSPESVPIIFGGADGAPAAIVYPGWIKWEAIEQSGVAALCDIGAAEWPFATRFAPTEWEDGRIEASVEVGNEEVAATVIDLAGDAPLLVLSCSTGARAEYNRAW